MNFKAVRITLLLLILAYVGFDTFWSNARATDWKRSLRVVIYPINADGSEQSDNYIKQLQSTDFDEINKTLAKQGERYDVQLSDPVRIDLAPEIKSKPPSLPLSRSKLDIMWWSIKFRFWAWKHDNYQGIKPQIKSFALYYDPKTHQSLKHSTGLKKAKLAVNHIFADTDYTKQNNVVILHELLHTLGATDKYDLATGLPFYPLGYASPDKSPLFPQKYAEIMGGQIALSKLKAKQPESLKDTIIGKETAREIGWLE